ncbi:MAG TPA: hypothetical protein VMX55_06570 [candidate division Zixibacteria bacterium]|nr:hypothetical protein [candidate division Zixibacteria bacterium]
MPQKILCKYGFIEINKKLKASLTLSSKKLFSLYPDAVDKLSFESKNLIRIAIDEGLMPSIRGKEKEIISFFENISQDTSKFGFDEEEAEEAQISEELKGEEMEEEDLVYSSEQETFDNVSGEIEGKIILGDDKMDSKLVPVKIQEKIELFYDRDGSRSTKDSVKSGYIEILNQSQKDRLWDIDLKLEEYSQTNLKEKSFQIQELDPQDSKQFEYTFEADIESEIAIDEFISTIGDPEVESYSLVNNADNDIFMKIKVKNNSVEEISNISLSKLLPTEFKNIQILDQSIGNSDIKTKNGSQIVFWEIEKLSHDEEAILDLRVQIYIEDKETKIRSGGISASYLSPKITSGLKIGSFDAYTNNSFNIVSSELEDEPNSYECKFVFENKSEFALRLVNADVYHKDDVNTKFIDIDPEEIPVIQAGGTWESKQWIYTSEEGTYPSFKSKVEFYTIADHQINTEIKYNLADIELAVAALDGNVTYSTDKLQSFKVTPFTISGKITNVGGAILNEVTLVENIQHTFLPPKLEEIKVMINGKPFEISYDAVTIEPDNLDPTNDHTVTIELKNLKDTDKGALKPGDEIEIKYPITAFKPTKDILYRADATLSANTYPPGKPIVIKADPIEIEVVHVRRNIAKGKDIQALDNEGEFEITLTVQNLGKSDLTNYVLTEKVASGLILEDISDKADVENKGDSKILTWKFDTIAAGETIEVKYKIKPSSDAKVSETQKDE